MTLKNIYEELKTVQELAWEGDDLMSQDTLFEMQERLANLTLRVAQECGELRDLVKSFPYLYSLK